MSQDKLILNLVGLKDPHIHFEAGAKVQTGRGTTVIQPCLSKRS